MREYAREYILEKCGEDALAKVEQTEYNGNTLLVYADDAVVGTGKRWS